MTLSCPFDLLTKSSDDMVKELLVECATIKSGIIFPLHGKEKLSDGFRYEGEEWILWYRDGGGKVQMVRQGMDVKKLLNKQEKCPECQMIKYYCNCNNIAN